MNYLILFFSLFLSSAAFACNCTVNLSNQFFASFQGSVEINEVAATSGGVFIPSGTFTVNYFGGSSIGDRIVINCEGNFVYDSEPIFTNTDQVPITTENLAENCTNCPEAGLACDDLNVCTINDQYDIATCECVGTFQDSDADGVCDAEDQCPGANDNLDADNNGTADCTEGTLPVEFYSYQADVYRENTRHSWRVEQLNAEVFNIQKRMSNSWNTIGSTPATDAQSEVYNYYEKLPEAGIYYYRIESIDKEGQKNYSDVIQVVIGQDGKATFVPHPWPEGVRGTKN